MVLLFLKAKLRLGLYPRRGLMVDCWWLVLLVLSDKICLFVRCVNVAFFANTTIQSLHTRALALPYRMINDCHSLLII